MGKETTIGWTDSTWNPWVGCTRISPGCKLCYMYRDQKRYGKEPSTIRRTSDPVFRAPLSKKKFGPLVFTCSWSDWFIEDADEWRPEAWDIIRECRTKKPEMIFQILTKRPGNILGRLPEDWGDGWSNVWLGVSVETAQYVPRIAMLCDIPAAKRFISYEPALDEVDFRHYLEGGKVDWLIMGGESGPGARNMWPSWVLKTQKNCAEAEVPFFFKQWGGTKKMDGEWGGCHIGEKEYKEFPRKIK